MWDKIRWLLEWGLLIVIGAGVLVGLYYVLALFPHD
jgi:hypothetical protein